MPPPMASLPSSDGAAMPRIALPMGGGAQRHQSKWLRRGRLRIWPVPWTLACVVDLPLCPCVYGKECTEWHGTSIGQTVQSKAGGHLKRSVDSSFEESACQCTVLCAHSYLNAQPWELSSLA